MPAFFWSWETEDTDEAAAAEVDDIFSELNVFLDAEVAEADAEAETKAVAEASEKVFFEATDETFGDDINEAKAAPDLEDWLGVLLNEGDALNEGEKLNEELNEELAEETAEEETTLDDEKREEDADADEDADAEAEAEAETDNGAFDTDEAAKGRCEDAKWSNPTDDNSRARVEGNAATSNAVKSGP